MSLFIISVSVSLIAIMFFCVNINLKQNKILEILSIAADTEIDGEWHETELKASKKIRDFTDEVKDTPAVTTNPEDELTPEQLKVNHFYS